MDTAQLLEEIRKHFEKSIKYDLMGLNAKQVEMCAFCDKTRNEVRMLVSGSRAYICDECIELCMEILQENGLANP